MIVLEASAREAGGVEVRCSGRRGLGREERWHRAERGREGKGGERRGEGEVRVSCKLGKGKWHSTFQGGNSVLFAEEEEDVCVGR